jgi:hypothetical protein
MKKAETAKKSDKKPAPHLVKSNIYWDDAGACMRLIMDPPLSVKWSVRRRLTGRQADGKKIAANWKSNPTRCGKSILQRYTTILCQTIATSTLATSTKCYSIKIQSSYGPPATPHTTIGTGRIFWEKPAGQVSRSHDRFCKRGSHDHFYKMDGIQ